VTVTTWLQSRSFAAGPEAAFAAAAGMFAPKRAAAAAAQASKTLRGVNHLAPLITGIG
jgi:hypothetical protein